VSKSKISQLSLRVVLGLVSALLPAWGFALAPSPDQGDTLKELIDVIEDRHYASRRYDDGLSAQHFAAYLDALDPQRMFFDAGDISGFNQWRLELDNVGRRGNLDPAFTIFNRYHAKLRQRLEKIIDTLPERWRSSITRSMNTLSSITLSCPGLLMLLNWMTAGVSASKIRL
jgi:carboxyl-terminal processing protease